MPKENSLPKTPDIPNDVNSLKLREFFNWKKHDLMTRHEVEKMLEGFQKEALANLFNKLSESEASINKVKQQISGSMEEFKESFKSGSQEMNLIIERNVQSQKIVIEDKLKKATDDSIKRITDYSASFEKKMNDVNSLNAEMMRNSENKLKDMISQAEKRNTDYATEFSAKKFETLMTKFNELNTKFYDFKQNNEFSLVTKEFEKKSGEIEKGFKHFQNIAEGLNEEMKAEFKQVRDVMIPELKSSVKVDLDSFKVVVNEKLQNMDPMAIAQATEDRLNNKFHDFTQSLDEIHVALTKVENAVSRKEFDELHEKFVREMKKVIEWINYFNTKG